MDYNSYKTLPPSEQAQIWQELLETPGWQVLKGVFEEKRAAIPAVKSADDREAFYFTSILLNGSDEVFNTPGQKLKMISAKLPKE